MMTFIDRYFGHFILTLIVIVSLVGLGIAHQKGTDTLDVDRICSTKLRLVTLVRNNGETEKNLEFYAEEYSQWRTLHRNVNVETLDHLCPVPTD